MSAGSHIAGTRQPVASTLTHVYPATGEVLGTWATADAQEVDLAVRTARAAFAGWSRRSTADRNAILLAARDRLAAAAEELAALMALEIGTPIPQVRATHVARMLENFEFFTQVAATHAGQTFQQMERYLTLTIRQPAGVAAIFSPWNAPYVLSSMKLAAALAVGCTVVIKPSEFTPFSVLRMVELMEEGGLPPGVVNVVNGPGPVTGRALSEHPGIDVIGFIGGTETGKAIMTAAAQRIAKVGLELGGKSANIVAATANLDAAIDGSLLAIFSGAGQQCLAGSRIFVERAIADRFISRFVERAENIRLGCPFDPATEMGPIAHEGHMNRVLSFADRAREEGAEILCGGRRAPGFDRGFWIEPTVALAPSNDLAICQQEIFGPFATIQIVDDLDEAVRRANDSQFGLVGYIWSDDLPTVTRVAAGLETGTVWVNTPLARDLRAPFGGWKTSGLGRDGREGCIDLFTEEKTVMVPTEPLALRPMGAGR
ncbi:MAG: aldehyde dehydrogenase family protein [Alphaproteobacteria bacterium]|nr:aldehyde dehydrogenase family protein [Alphaproteobacteria bacterium]